MSVYSSNEVNAQDAEFSVLAAGTYTFQVTELIAEQTKAKMEGRAGKGLIFKLKAAALVDGGGTIINRFNVENDNPEAQKIGRAQFKLFHQACGFDVLDVDTEDDLNKLVNRTFVSRVKHREYNGKSYPELEPHTFKRAGQPQTGQLTNQTSNLGAGAHGAVQPPTVPF